MSLSNLPQKSFEKQTETSYAHLFGRSPDIIVYEHEQNFSIATFEVELSIDAIQYYAETTQHSVYRHTTDVIAKNLKKDIATEMFQFRTYIVITLFSKHQVIAVKEKVSTTKFTNLVALPKINTTESDYAYDMFSCQIFIPMPENKEDFHVWINSQDPDILGCIFTCEHLKIISLN